MHNIRQLYNLRPIRQILAMLISLLFTLLLLSCSSEQPSTNNLQAPDTANNDTLRIAAASNLAHILPEIIESFKIEHNQIANNKIEVTYASSGKLYAQIISGAPYDIFLSADRLYPQKLKQTLAAKSSHTHKPFTYTRGQLALYSANVPLINTLDGKPLNTGQLAKLFNTNSSSHNARYKVAIANPEVAPYGASTRAYLESKHLYDLLIGNKQIIQAENIGQTFQYTHSGSVNFGFVALSQVVATAVKPIKFYALPPHTYPAILQDGLVISNNPNASKFADFLRSKKSQQQFNNAGYLLVN